MFAANRSERREEILDMLEEKGKTENIVDYTLQMVFLEGTGSLLLDEKQ
jgi:hypothetical protein